VSWDDFDPGLPARALEPLPWMTDAACTTTDPELFFPGIAEPAAPAKRICSDCPVTAECFEYTADFSNDKYGIFGGLAPKERARLRRQAA